MIRVRRSHLDKFRELVTTEYGDQAELESAIRGNPSAPSWQALAGTAWHAVLATPEKFCRVNRDLPAIHKDSCYYRVDDDHLFHADDVTKARAILGPGDFEVTRRKVYNIGNLPVEVEATVDHIYGLVVKDSKTRFGTLNPEDYDRSLQWRFYLDIHDCDVFEYHLWRMDDKEAPWFSLREHLSFSQRPYPGMVDELHRWLRDFVAWVMDRDLLQYLQVHEDYAEV